MIDLHPNERIVIVGGGIAGLSIALRLAEAGLHVALLEASQLGRAASTRNQGWLHGGGWFAPTDRELARMCHQSLKQTLRFCPNCLEPQNVGMAYLFPTATTDVARWTQAWTQAGIPFEELPMSRLASLGRGLESAQVQCAFLLFDCSIRSDVLLAQLADAAQQAGVDIRTQTPTAKLQVQDGCAVGVVTTAGEEVAARIVILAAGAAGKPLWAELTSAEAGQQVGYTCVLLKTHLVAVAPEVSSLPLCVVDRDGFNHTPHASRSIFGLDRWSIVTDPADQQLVPHELERLWDRIHQFFPDVNRDDDRIAEWAGTTVQALHFDQVQPGVAPRPTVIDHSREPRSVANLLSVFPGRATLWRQLADQATRLVLEKLDTPHRQSIP